MKRWTVMFLSMAGCTWDMVPPEETLRGFSRAELEAGPTDRQMHAAILFDVRRGRFLDQHLDDGTPTCSAFKAEGAKSICVSDQSDMTFFDFTKDPADQPYRVDETAYFCPKESVYYYHYVGGPRRLDVWLGPFKIDRPARKLDDLK
jgi:hypothetical protein